MATSVIPAVKAALVTEITAAVPAGVSVVWGDPRGGREPDTVIVGNVTGEQAAAALGRQRRRETFTVQVHVTVERPDLQTPQAVAERAYVIAGEIEDALRADERLGGLGTLVKAEVVKTDLTEGIAADPTGRPTEKRMAEVTMHVRCESRI